MKRLIIIVEGQTEQEFVNSILAPYFREKEIYSVTAVPIHKRGGGKGDMPGYADCMIEGVPHADQVCKYAGF